MHHPFFGFSGGAVRTLSLGPVASGTSATITLPTRNRCVILGINGVCDPDAAGPFAGVLRVSAYPGDVAVLGAGWAVGIGDGTTDIDNTTWFVCGPGLVYHVAKDVNGEITIQQGMPVWLFPRNVTLNIQSVGLSLRAGEVQYAVEV